MNWIVEMDDTGWNKHTCSKCGYVKRTDIHVSLGWDYCPKCGEQLNGDEKVKHSKDYIYLITVFDKLERDDRYGFDVGCTRSVGWRPTFEMAKETVETNMCDIWETCYNYACIEELDHSLYPCGENRWFYQYNKESGKYEKITEPEFMKYHGPIGGIG